MTLEEFEKMDNKEVLELQKSYTELLVKIETLLEKLEKLKDEQDV